MNCLYPLHKSETARGNDSVYLADLKSCSIKRDIYWGRRIHAKVAETGSDSHKFVVTALIRMYAKCGSMVDARFMFDSLENPDVVSWNVLLLGYAENGQELISLELFPLMKVLGCAASSVTYVAILKSWTSLAVNGDGIAKEECLERGRNIHLEIGCHLDHYVQSTLIDMYAKCGSMVEARRIFDSIQKPDVVSWTAMVLGYADNGEGLTALELFSRMKMRGCMPNSVTYVAALRACTSLAVNGDGSAKNDCLQWGKQIHLEIGCYLNYYVQSALIDMYARGGSMVDARRVFDSFHKPDVVSCNALLLGYAENGEGSIALELFSTMKVRALVPDSTTYVAAIKACTSLASNGDGTEKAYCLERGKEIHLEVGCHLNHFVQSSLIDMYGKCGSMEESRRIFDSMQNPDVVSWNALLMGYAENGDGSVALELFLRMKACGCTPNSVTYVAALKACGLLGALAVGRKLHSEIREFTARVVTSLVDFYAKCGSMAEAREIFDLHSKERVVPTWTALLAGYARFGDSDSVFKLFEKMQDDGFCPDAVTFVGMLLCLSHAGLVEKARQYFEAMTVQFKVTPTVMHYTCMVDVLGRANHLDEAIAIIYKMPCNPDAATWNSFLSACRKWNNVEMGRMAFLSLVHMDKKDSTAHLLLAHIYGRPLEIAINCGAWNLPGEAYVLDGVGNVVKFGV